jgi:hypothetical protein
LANVVSKRSRNFSSTLALRNATSQPSLACLVSGPTISAQ